MALNFKNQHKPQASVDNQVRKALRNLLDMRPREQRTATSALESTSRQRPRLTEASHTDKATQLGFVRAKGGERSFTSMGDLVAARSDAIPGLYSCIECGHRFGVLQEAWRDTGAQLTNMTTLFCEGCAMRVRSMTAGMSTGPNLAPIQFTDMDKLNMGQFVSSFGVVEAPVAAAEPVKQTAAEIWAGKLK